LPVLHTVKTAGVNNRSLHPGNYVELMAWIVARYYMVMLSEIKGVPLLNADGLKV